MRRLWGRERGFTLPEVMIVIVLMGLVFAIATSSWFGLVESRAVDSAANQLVADLRLAHSTATNRLVEQEVSLTDGGSEYSMTGSASPRDLDEEPANDAVIVDTTATITFTPDGSADLPGDADSITITVGSSDGNSNHTIEVIAATSRVQIDP
jgi:type IV fimbrial biogenesis protein FimT